MDACGGDHRSEPSLARRMRFIPAEAVMFERFRSLPEVWRSGRLALRLLRDPRVPIAAKVLFGAAVVYMLSPLDLVPDWLPVLGQADDLVVLLAGLNLFLKACPRWLVEEHEEAMRGGRDLWRAEDRRATPSGPTGPSTIDGEYRRVN
jgi:uncharacterized membrane protein YkvA (DUF1232 family)